MASKRDPSEKPAAKRPAAQKPPTKPKAKPKAPAKPRRKAPLITEEMIAERAYHIALSGEGGSDEENWLRAESELRGA